MGLQLKIPESLSDYLGNTGIETAVNQLLLQKPDQVPLDLAWDEVIAYHDALLMAFKVRRDYFVKLLEIWELVWKPKLSSGLFGEEISIADLEAGERPTPETVWDDSLYRVFQVAGKPNVKFYTALAMNPKEGVIAYFACDEQVSLNSIQQVMWSSKIDEQGYRHTVEYLAVPDDSGTILLDKLSDAAEKAVEALAHMEPE